MAFNLPEYAISYTTNEDLSSDQYKFLVQDTSTGYVRKPTSQSEYLMGILNNVPSATPGGQLPAAVVLMGVTRLRVADAYSVGTFLMAEYNGASADDTGRGLNASGSLKYARAIQLQASTAADDIVAVRLIDQNPS
jgi:hypothetical protein